jgi:hypothetical protein
MAFSLYSLLTCTGALAKDRSTEPFASNVLIYVSLSRSVPSYGADQQHTIKSMNPSFAELLPPAHLVHGVQAKEATNDKTNVAGQRNAAIQFPGRQGRLTGPVATSLVTVGHVSAVSL